MSIRHMVTLIPARDEERLLPRCIASVLRAQAVLPAGVSCDVIVAVDSSTDGTYEIAKAMLGERGHALLTRAGNVGTARALAANAALQRTTAARRSCWLANTDADCEVPEHWLLDQWLLANSGVEAVAGIVDVDDFSEHCEGVQQRFRETYLIHSDGTHPHVHGANLGMRADTYLRVGGWANLRTAEDHDLWNRCRDLGYRQQSVAHLKVVTSGRKVGRAPDGFAGALAKHNEVFA